MDMLNKWIYVLLLFQFILSLRVVHCYDFYCKENLPVVEICKDSSVDATNLAFVSSGAAPLLQRIIGCECNITGTAQLTLTLDKQQMTKDMDFFVQNEKLKTPVNARGTVVSLVYSKYNDKTTGGGCVKIQSDSSFSVTCKAKKTTDTDETNGEETDSGETATGVTEALAGDPDNGNGTIIAAAIGGAVGFIALVVCVAVCFVLGRKRKSPSNAGSANNTKDYEDTTNNYGLQPNPAYEGFEPDKENKTQDENDYEEQYAIPDAPQRGDRLKTTEYDYTDFKPSAASTSSTMQQLTPNDTDNTYDHTITISTEKTGVTENEYNHLPLSFIQNAKNDDYNTLGDIHVQPKHQHVESDYNVLGHP